MERTKKNTRILWPVLLIVVLLATSSFAGEYCYPQCQGYNQYGFCVKWGQVCVPAAPDLTVAKDPSGTGTGNVTSSPGGISCGDTCKATFAPNTVITLIASPPSDSSFAGWAGGGCSGTGVCQVTLTADTTVTAKFNILPPVANFTSSTTTGFEPFVVNFSDLSQRAVSWLWDFGDGSTSSLRNTSHTYRTPGTYSVSLTVTNPSGTNSVTKTNYASVSTCPNQPVKKVGADITYYDTVYHAYRASSNGDVIKLQDRTYLEGLSIYGSLTIDGGYDCGFANKTGSTTLKGNEVSINDGVTIIKDVVIDK